MLKFLLVNYLLSLAIHCMDPTWISLNSARTDLFSFCFAFN